ncbi:MAG: helix-hairpin-helix domain-containing protein [Candidatus Shapirobacteria bacterium]|jgi:competence protein ComEA
MLKKLRWIDGVLILGIGLIAVGLGMDWKRQNSAKAELIKNNSGDLRFARVSPSPARISPDPARTLIIDVGGAVIKAGVYRLADGARVNDALVVAGGLSAQADREWVEANINKAEILRDGMKIYIPLKDQISKIKNQNLTQSSKILGLGTDQESGLININTATVEELDKLPGVGPSIGQKIIDYRAKNGGFRDINEIKLVSGVGEKMFEKIKDKISL